MTVRTIEVKVDPSIHERAPLSVIETETWATLDTAWNLLRESAVRITLQSMREQAAEQGVPFPSTDEELFRRMRGSSGPTSYRDLAPGDDLAAHGLHSVLQVLVNRAGREAREGIQDFHDELDGHA